MLTGGYHHGNFTEKIDFAVVFAVSHANPNGDPLTGNRPVKPMTDMEKFPMSV